MRRGTILVLLALILLVAFFGALRVFATLLVALAAFVILLFVALFVGAWLLKRRMRRRLAELQEAVRQAAQREGERQRTERARRDAIDTEFSTDERK